MKHIEEFELNEGHDSSKALTGFKQEIYKKAKDEYMNLLADMLKGEGVNVNKIISTDNIDDFAGDGFECTYDGIKFKIVMSNRGVSIGKQGGDSSYSTKIKSFVDKLKRA